MFKEILKEKGLHVTKQRIAILEALKNIKKPATIDFIKENIIGEIHHVTLYRSLATLVEFGLVYQTDFREGVAYFELQKDNYHHHHLVCTRCKEKKDFSYCPNIPIEKINKDLGFLVQSHIFEIFGVCNSCTHK
jgi:Fe2+ or Zn2+ uptake regulation protein